MSENKKLTPAERKALARKREVEMLRMKRTHDWIQTFSINKLRQSGAPMLSCCRRCGINYWLFKANPTICPNSENKEDKKEDKIDTNSIK
jgi:uncharacterized Zn finger protein (UPF0148 family)